MPLVKIQTVLALLIGLLLTQAAPQIKPPPEHSAANETTPPQYNVTVIAPFPYISDDIALGLNDAGEAALWRKTSGELIHAAWWRQGKTGGKARPELRDKFTEWPLPQTFLNTIPRAINGKRQAAGWGTASPNLVDSLASVHALFFDGAKCRDLGTLGGKNSQAFSLNADGQTVGVAQDASGSKSAFVWNRGKMRGLSTLPNGKYSAAYGINKAGDIVGVSAFDLLNNHAVMWHKGKITDLGVLPDGSGSFARAINDRDRLWASGAWETIPTLFFTRTAK